MIGFLLYLTVFRSDIMFVICVCVRYQVFFRKLNFIAVKRIFRYLKGVFIFGIWYSVNGNIEFSGYSDSDFAGC